jgi:hypothetical protein
MPDMEGITVGPKQAHSISLKTHLHTRLGGHFKKCSDDSEEFNLYAERYGVKYSQQVSNNASAIPSSKNAMLHAGMSNILLPETRFRCLLMF